MAQRDRFFLELAREVIFKEGFQVLTMSRLAEESGFTRGTLYQRFGSREGILVELWIECLTELTDLMNTAAGLEGTTRERATAIFEAVGYYFISHPENLPLLGAIGPEYIAAAISDDQRASLAEADTQLISTFLTLAEEAIEAGELILPQGAKPTTLCLTLWTVFEGMTAFLRGSLTPDALDMEDPTDEIGNSLQWILDGYGWRPFSNEWDYSATRRRVRATLFFGEDAN